MPGWLIAALVIIGWILCSLIVTLIKIFIFKEYETDDDDKALIFFGPVTLLMMAVYFPIHAAMQLPEWLGEYAKNKEKTKKTKQKKRSALEDYNTFLGDK